MGEDGANAARTSSWGELSVDLLAGQLAGLVRPWQMGRLRLVCRGWAGDIVKGLRELDASGAPPADVLACFASLERLEWRSPPAGLPGLQQLTSLTSLELSGTTSPITDSDLARVEGLHLLRHLNVSGCYGITGAGLRSLKQLTSVRLSNCGGLTVDGLASLQHLTSLTSLHLVNPSIKNDLRLDHLGGIPSLTSLALIGCQGGEQESPADLQPITSLTSLKLKHCQNLSNLIHLEAHPSVTRLHIEGCPSLDGDALRGLTGLRSLTFHGAATDAIPWQLRSLTSLTLSRGPLGSLTHLRSLTHLTICDGSYDSLRPVAAFHALRSLDLCWCSGLGLANAPPLTSLKSLALTLQLYRLGGAAYVNLGDAVLDNLHPLVSLTSLTLRQCKKLSDNALAKLSPLSSLAELHLCNYMALRLTGLAHLHPLTTLRVLSLSHGYVSTTEAVRALKGHLPLLR